MFRLWHILAIITIGALVIFIVASLAGSYIIGIGIGISLGGIVGYKHIGRARHSNTLTGSLKAMRPQHEK